MKVLMIGQIPTELGGSYTTGVGNVVKFIAEKLATKIKLIVYATNYNEQLNNNIKLNFNLHGYKKRLLPVLIIKLLINRHIYILKFILNLKKYGIKKTLKSILYASIINNLIDLNKPDIIHLHGIYYLPIMKLLNIQIPYITTFHGIFIYDNNAIEFNKKSGLDIRKLFYNTANIQNYITFLNKDMQSIAKRELKIKLDKSFIIPNGVNVDDFYFSEAERNFTRKKLGIDKNTKVLLTVGSIQDRKGQIDFMNFLINSDLKENIKYILIGKNTYDELFFLNQIQEKKLQDTVEVISYVNNFDLHKYYSASDIYVHASTSEGQSLVVFEALACGLPVIVNEKVKNTLGLDLSYNEFYRIIDFNQIYEYSIFNFNLDRKKISNKSRQELNWDKISMQYLHLYKSIVSHENL